MSDPCIECCPGSETACDNCAWRKADAEISRLTRELERHADQKKVFRCGHENVGCCVFCAMDHAAKLMKERDEERAARVEAEKRVGEMEGIIRLLEGGYCDEHGSIENQTEDKGQEVDKTCPMCALLDLAGDLGAEYRAKKDLRNGGKEKPNG